MATALEELYERDFYAWTRDQAGALRRLADERWNGPLDLERLAEEVEGLGNNERNTVVSQLRRVLIHLLKLEYSPGPAPRRKWLVTINDARAEAAQHLTPSIRNDGEPTLSAIYRQARRQAALELDQYDEEAAADALPEACPYTLDQLLDDDWLPSSRHGHVDKRR
jgi:Domain of unknown function DUF29